MEKRDHEIRRLVETISTLAGTHQPMPLPSRKETQSDVRGRVSFGG